MNHLHEQRARELVEQLERAGMNCELFAVQGSVVLPWTVHRHADDNARRNRSAQFGRIRSARKTKDHRQL
jgi:hypothetical protein